MGGPPLTRYKPNIHPPTASWPVLGPRADLYNTGPTNSDSMARITSITCLGDPPVILEGKPQPSVDSRWISLLPLDDIHPHTLLLTSPISPSIDPSLLSRFQALMPDVLHWLGINVNGCGSVAADGKKRARVVNMVSMSNMKYDAVVGRGIDVGRKYGLPDHLIPLNSHVEIDAKITSGYFSTRKDGNELTPEELRKTVGWEEVEHCTLS
ncbi:hypothetical protein D9758_012500 [Tetrapyrgos nigripes]|uniref:Uncharacterized protein n=1 Tax=Tetrapyrgos nigripes TaxID=182062 RepID=A0A8H5G317_9AGAR|nr:hypothetical protein D9758_012500 [Tetrapyrgos nigripes]